MNQRALFVGLVVGAVLAIGCGDDDDGAPDVDAGPDGGEAGSGGGGRGGAGGQAGGAGKPAAGSGGEGEAGSGGEGEAGSGGEGEAGSGGEGGGGSVAEYNVGGTLSGLSGTGLVLRINDRDDLTPTANGGFTFSMKLKAGDEYTVTVYAQPMNPTQSCTVSHGGGEVVDHDVTDISVTCSASSYKVGGNVTGLTTSGLILRNNGGDDLSVSAAGTFSFATQLASDAAYAVTIQAQPSGQSCGLSAASGQVGTADVTSVVVTCVDVARLQAVAGFGTATLSWSNTAATRYDLYSYRARGCDIDQLSSCQSATAYADVHSPYTATGLSNGQGYYFRLKATHSDSLSVRSNETGARPNKPEYDGDVLALATAADGAVYVGGAFQRLSVHSGAAIPLHAETGLASEWVNFPVVEGEVAASAPDGSGGMYIGGDFTRVDDAAHAYLIHVRSDGTLDPNWNPNPDGMVSALAVRSGTVYAAGLFNNIGGAMRAGLAAIGTDGNATGWNPAPNIGGTATAPYVLLATSDALYVGGAFTTISGTGSARLARFGANDAFDSAFVPNPDNDVLALAVTSQKLYVGGRFGNIGGAQRVQLAELQLDGQATAWDPQPNDSVSSIVVSGDGATVYVAGQFTSFTGANTPRNGLAAISSSDGSVSTWDPNPDDRVFALAIRGSTIYAGGRFGNIAGVLRNRVAAIGADGQATAWDPNLDGEVRALSTLTDPPIVYVSGVFDGTSGVTRKHLVGFDASGYLTNWNPGADDVVHALAIGTGSVYVGGSFSNVGGSARNRIAALDSTTGNALTWNPNANAAVRTIVPAGATLYAAGDFTSIGGQSRGHIAALDPASDAATGWISDASGPVLAVAVSGSTIYVGGAFITIKGENRNRIAALETANGNVTAWNPDANGAVSSLAVAGGTVYAGGEFTMIGGAVRNRLAAIGSGGSADSTFDPNLNGPVSFLAVGSDRLYVAGDYVTVGLTSRNRVAAYDLTDGTLTTWAPNVEGPVYAVGLATDKVYLGGSFFRVDGAFNSNLVTVAPSE